MKYLLLFLGLIFLAIGFVGIIVPGLPTTPFWLIAAGLFFRSSNRMYNWVINNKFYGKHIRNYREKKGITFTAKVVSIGSMWTMIILSMVFIFESREFFILLPALGLAGTIFLLIIPTIKE
ncbi:MAG: YbaN family protein [Bacteroidales bacterium]|nr:YbaN family protein [Bacteroidales bacterium]